MHLPGCYFRLNVEPVLHGIMQAKYKEEKMDTTALNCGSRSNVNSLNHRLPCICR